MRSLSSICAGFVLLLAGKAFALKSVHPRDVARHLMKAPESAEIAGASVRVKVDLLWRDFMPGPADLDRDRLRVALHAESSKRGGLMVTRLPDGVVPDRLWCIHGESVWESALAMHAPGSEGAQQSMTASGGPKWDLGARVTCVLRVRDRHQKFHLMRATPIEISSTS